MTYTLIAHTEVGSGGAASITFMSVGDIPSTFTDLLLVVSGRTNRSSVVDAINVRPNNQTSNRTIRVLGGNGSSAFSFNDSAIYVDGITGNNATSNTFGNAQIYIPNYRAAAAKSFSMDGVSETNGTESYQTLTAGLWNSTDAITSLVIAPLTGSLFLQHTSATLYGITAGSDGTTVVS